MAVYSQGVSSMSSRDRSAATGWLKIVVALICTAAAGTFIYLRARGPVPARVDPKFRQNGLREWNPRGPRAEPTSSTPSETD
jgi:hypothetical protein